ncbi:MAG: gingipain R [Candidatus Eisenbacteria bacterium]|nr:gingipain R [Candidatus Eisenbacteria bacterium]
MGLSAPTVTKPHGGHPMFARVTLGRSLLLGASLLLALSLLPAGAAARWIDLGGESTEVTLIESSDARTVLEVTVGGFDARPITIDGATYHQITMGEENVQPVAGFPALPDVRRSLIIPDDRQMHVRVLESEYVEFPEMPVAPSKGILLRTVDPATVPYPFDPFYQSDDVYPATVTEGHEPYILRDFRGMVLDANVFQYFAGTQTLRVYTRLRIEVAEAGAGVTNILERSRPPEQLDAQFAGIYEKHFLNYASLRYVPVLEQGDLLVICYDDFVAHMQPFVDWKLQKGLPTRMVTVSEAGGTASAILDYIQNEYDTTDLAYVLLVGDAGQVPTFTYSGGGSDPSYSLLAGSDNYPDIFVGRFSAENTGHVDTQVERTITYERDIAAGADWPQYGMGVASNQGPGHYNEYDDEHMDYIRDDLLGYGYYAVDQIYDPYGTAQMVADGLNEGRGIVNYCGHGSTTSWGSTGFSNSHVNALVNDNMLPFICSVACVNGNFTSSTCFGEAWLRATNNGNGLPTGAIATYMSSINQSWDPPMEAEDEAVDLLIADQMRTIGGLWYNGSCLMIDVYGGGGVEMFMTWHIFGDPSVAVRTATPQELTVNHVGTLFLGMDSYDVNVPGVEGALCALYADGVLYGSALTDGAGLATIDLPEPPIEPMTLTLTVTAYNKETHLGTVDVIPAEGPYLIVSDVEYIDGNGDAVLNAGEGVEMRVQLRNVGIETAVGIAATVSTENEHIDLTVAEATWPNLGPDETAWCEAPFAFTILPDCPDQTTVEMPIAITGDERLLWESQINFVVQAPAIVIGEVLVDDTAGGNGNYRLDPGETATVAVTLENDGSYALADAVGTLIANHPLITIDSDTGSAPLIDAGGNATLFPPFSVTIDEAFSPYSADFYLDLVGANDYQSLFDMPLPVGGFFENMEEGPGDWSHYVVSGGSFVDDWHLSTERNHSPNGEQSWKCGDTGTGDYSNLLDAGLETPPAEIGTDGELRFWMWIEAEVSGAYPGRCYDGGLVEMSVDAGPFEQITPEGGYPYTIRPGSEPGPFPDETPVFSGSFDWHQQIFDLGDVTGTVVFRFRFGSDGADTREGWHIDDLEVLGLSNFSDARPLDLLPSHALLQQNTPNPFGASTRIAFAVPQSERALLQVFDPSGRLVRTLLDGSLSAGFHSVVWDGRTDAGPTAGSGVYYYRLSTDSTAQERSLILLR